MNTNRSPNTQSASLKVTARGPSKLMAAVVALLAGMVGGATSGGVTAAANVPDVETVPRVLDEINRLSGKFDTLAGAFDEHAERLEQLEAAEQRAAIEAEIRAELAAEVSP